MGGLWPKNRREDEAGSGGGGEKGRVLGKRKRRRGENSAGVETDSTFSTVDSGPMGGLWSSRGKGEDKGSEEEYDGKRQKTVSGFGVKEAVSPIVLRRAGYEPHVGADMSDHNVLHSTSVTPIYLYMHPMYVLLALTGPCSLMRMETWLMSFTRRRGW